MLHVKQAGGSEPRRVVGATDDDPVLRHDGGLAEDVAQHVVLESPRNLLQPRPSLVQVAQRGEWCYRERRVVGVEHQLGLLHAGPEATDIESTGQTFREEDLKLRAVLCRHH